MDIQQVLKEHKRQFDRELTAFLDRVIVESRERDAFMAEALEYVKTFSLSGGKRLRSTLMYYGYVAAGGTDRKRMMNAALSVELIHIFLLMHDDIIDRDELRHGVKTVHCHFADLGKKLFPETEHAHFGASMGIILGDMMHALGNRVLFESFFDPALVLRALSKLQTVVALTVIGQTEDVHIEYRKKASEEEILQMYEYKTARYTVEGPLHLGAILAGADDAFLERLSRYAVPIGIAFQIQDDILGIFGTEEKLGKPIDSDIAEGKRTILVSNALENLSARECRELELLLNRGDALTKEDVRRFRDLMRQSGALDAAKDMAGESIAKGKAAMLEWEGIDSEAKEFLIGVADFMAQRES